MNKKYINVKYGISEISIGPTTVFTMRLRTTSPIGFLDHPVIGLIKARNPNVLNYWSNFGEGNRGKIYHHLLITCTDRSVFYNEVLPVIGQLLKNHQIHKLNEKYKSWSKLPEYEEPESSFCSDDEFEWENSVEL